MNRSMRYKVKASTLVESIVALLLFAISTTMGMMAYYNIINSTRVTKTSKAETAVLEMMSDTQEKAEWIDKEEDINGFTLKRTVSRYSLANDVYMVEISAIDRKAKILFSTRALIHAE